MEVAESGDIKPTIPDFIAFHPAAGWREKRCGGVRISLPDSVALDPGYAATPLSGSVATGGQSRICATAASSAGRRIWYALPAGSTTRPSGSETGEWRRLSAGNLAPCGCEVQQEKYRWKSCNTNFPVEHPAGRTRLRWWASSHPATLRCWLNRRH